MKFLNGKWYKSIKKSKYSTINSYKATYVLMTEDVEKNFTTSGKGIVIEIQMVGDNVDKVSYCIRQKKRNYIMMDCHFKEMKKSDFYIMIKSLFTANNVERDDYYY